MYTNLKNWLSAGGFCIIALLISHTAGAQVVSPVKWGFEVKKISKTDSELVFTATISKGWHLYAQDIAEGGPIPTTFNFDKGMGYFLVGKVEEPPATEVIDKNFDMKVKYYSDKVVFTQKVRVASPKPVEVKGYVEYMCCDDTRCLPPDEAPFKFTLPASK